jgi:hypothetical protein
MVKGPLLELQGLMVSSDDRQSSEHVKGVSEETKYIRELAQNQIQVSKAERHW